jgi:hypothetical protein
MVGAEHTDAGAKLGASEGDHVLSDVCRHHLSVLGGSIVENPLHQVVAILVAGNINQRDPGTITAALADTVEVAAQELGTPNLETLLHHLGGKLVSAVLGCITDDMVNGPAAIRRSTVLADVLDAPVPELPVSNDVDVGKDLFDAGPLSSVSPRTSRTGMGSACLVLLETVLEDVLDDQASGLTQGNLVPHTAESFIDILHDLGRGRRPSELEKFLPHMAGIAMDHSLGNPTQKLVHHDSLVVLRDRIKGFLDHVAAEWVHGEVQGVTTDGFGNLDDLLGSAMFKAALDEEVAKSVDHQGVCLGHNGLDNLVLLLRGAHLELLLKENRGLLVIVAHNLVDNVLPVAVDIAVEETPVVQGLSWW